MYADQAAQTEAQERERLLLKAQYQWLMSNKQGRSLMYMQLGRAGIWRSSFSTDALAMAFAEGQRQTGLLLLSDLQTFCPDLCVQMMQEQQNHE
jgi:hypothetical protein